MYKPILAALAFILSPDGKETLLIHRNKRKNDHHFGKFNGLGGKMEAEEDIITCITREINEEAGIQVKDISLRQLEIAVMTEQLIERSQLVPLN